MIDERIFAEIRYERGRNDAPPGFPSMPEIPGGRYTRQDFFDLEVEHVFRKSWVMAGHVEEVPAPGAYKLFTKLLGAPILIVRGRDDVVRAFYNTCRHRGAPVVKDEAGRCNVLRCQYHSWAYDFDGRLIQVPDEHDFGDFDKEARGLIPVRCEIYRGVIFVNQDPDAAPLIDWMGPLAEEWSWTGLETLRVDYRWSRIIDCNWKCALDAFQEVYHINTLHGATVGAMLEYKAATMGLLPGGHSRMCVRYTGADIDNAPEGGWPPGEMYRRTSVAQTLWPCLNIPWGPGTGKFILFWPRGVAECEVEVLGVGEDWGDGPLPAERAANNEQFDNILMEDVLNLEAIQASLNSGAFTGMMLNYQERRIYWSHEQIDRAIGAAQVPEGLAVTPMLEPWVERMDGPQVPGR